MKVMIPSCGNLFAGASDRFEKLNTIWKFKGYFKVDFLALGLCVDGYFTKGITLIELINNYFNCLR